VIPPEGAEPPGAGSGAGCCCWWPAAPSALGQLGGGGLAIWPGTASKQPCGLRGRPCRLPGRGPSSRPSFASRQEPRAGRRRCGSAPHRKPGQWSWPGCWRPRRQTALAGSAGGGMEGAGAVERLAPLLGSRELLDQTCARGPGRRLGDDGVISPLQVFLMPAHRSGLRTIHRQTWPPCLAQHRLGAASGRDQRGRQGRRFATSPPGGPLASRWLRSSSAAARSRCACSIPADRPNLTKPITLDERLRTGELSWLGILPQCSKTERTAAIELEEHGMQAKQPARQLQAFLSRSRSP